MDEQANLQQPKSSINWAQMHSIAFGQLGLGVPSTLLVIKKFDEAESRSQWTHVTCSAPENRSVVGLKNFTQHYTDQV